MFDQCWANVVDGVPTLVKIEWRRQKFRGLLKIAVGNNLFKIVALVPFSAGTVFKRQNVEELKRII